MIYSIFFYLRHVWVVVVSLSFKSNVTNVCHIKNTKMQFKIKKKINVYQQAILDIKVQKTSSFDQDIPGSSYTNSVFEVILERAAQ